MREIKIGRWDCESCGHKGVYGPSTKCTSCGHPRPKNVVFYLPVDAETVTDSAGIAEALAGPDWICDHCTAQNPATRDTCHACGQVYEHIEDDSLRIKDYKTTEDAPNDSGEADNVMREEKLLPPSKKKRLSSVRTVGYDALNIVNEGAEISQREYERDKRGYEKRNPETVSGSVPIKDTIERVRLYPKLSLIVGVLLGALLLTSFLIAAFWKVDTHVQVVSHQWSTRVSVQQWDWNYSSGWSVPSMASEHKLEITSTEDKIHHYDQVLDHYDRKTRTVQVSCGTETYDCGARDLGNGRFETRTCTRTKYCDKQEEYSEAVYRQEPRYQTYYSYRYLDWIEHKVLTESGYGTTLHYAAPTVITDHPKNWRYMRFNGPYVVNFKDNEGNVYTKSISGMGEWKRYVDGQYLNCKRYWMWGTLTDLPF